MCLELPGGCSDARAHCSHDQVPRGQEFTIFMCLAKGLAMGFGWGFIYFSLLFMTIQVISRVSSVFKFQGVSRVFNGFKSFPRLSDELFQLFSINFEWF